jgi:hypothetical protein
MTEIHDGQALSIDIPDAGGVCFAFPPHPDGAPAVPDSLAVECAAIRLGAIVPLPPARLVAAGAVALDGSSIPARFTLRFFPEERAAEPSRDSARDFATREASRYAPAPADGGSVDILAVGSSPATGAPSVDLVTFGDLHLARATFTLDLRESGRDGPVHVVSYGAWSRSGGYVLSVEGDDLHAPAADAFAEQAARTLVLKDPAPPAPSDIAQIGARIGQAGLAILVMLAVVLAVLGARTRKLRD